MSREWLSLTITLCVYSIAALVFIFTTFVTQAYQDKFESSLDKKLDRIEKKIDLIIDLKLNK